MVNLTEPLPSGDSVKVRTPSNKPNLSVFNAGAETLMLQFAVPKSVLSFRT
jgi:hypothetical protein